MLGQFKTYVIDAPEHSNKDWLHGFGFLNLYQRGVVFINGHLTGKKQSRYRRYDLPCLQQNAGPVFNGRHGEISAKVTISAERAFISHVKIHSAKSKIEIDSFYIFGIDGCA